MDDPFSNDQPASGDEGQTEDLAARGWRDAGWFPRTWQTRIAVLVIFCLGLGIGLAGSYAWIHHERQRQPRLDATLYELQQHGTGKSSVPVKVRVRSADQNTVTIDKARLSLPGFTITSGGLDDAAKLSRNDSHDVSYELAPECDAKAKGPARLRLRTHVHGHEKQWVTKTLPRPAIDAAGELASRHSEHCANISALRVQGRHASSSGDVLTLRVRLAVAAPPREKGSREPPRGTRLRKLKAHITSEVGVVFHAAGHDHSQKSTVLPATGKLRFRINECAGKQPRPPGLNATVATPSLGDQEIPVRYDRKAAASILSFVSEHCD